MATLLRLGGRRNDGPVERLVLLHALRQGMTAEIAVSPRIMVPCRSGGDAGQVAADHHLDGNQAAFPGHEDIGVRHVDQVVLDDVASPVEPEGRGLVDNLALEGQRAQHPVESGNPVGGHDDPLAVQAIVVPDFAFELLSQVEAGTLQNEIQLSPDDFVSQHAAERPFPSVERYEARAGRIVFNGAGQRHVH